MNPSKSPADSRERSRQLALALAPRVNLAGRPLLRIAAGTTIMWAGEMVTQLAFLETGHVDAVLHLQGADGGQVIPITFGDGEVVALSRIFGAEPGQLDLVAATELRTCPMRASRRRFASNMPVSKPLVCSSNS